MKLVLNVEQYFDQRTRFAVMVIDDLRIFVLSMISVSVLFAAFRGFDMNAARKPGNQGASGPGSAPGTKAEHAVTLPTSRASESARYLSLRAQFFSNCYAMNEPARRDMSINDVRNVLESAFSRPLRRSNDAVEAEARYNRQAGQTPSEFLLEHTRRTAAIAHKISRIGGRRSIPSDRLLRYSTTRGNFMTANTTRTTFRKKSMRRFSPRRCSPNSALNAETLWLCLKRYAPSTTTSFPVSAPAASCRTRTGSTNWARSASAPSLPRRLCAAAGSSTRSCKRRAAK